ncbi:MAG: hypothetical protein DWB93_02005 [Candidatus Poseidoniales archaeon]|nr:MAG: hypothetical protein DWB93_02005 [Candidatus Poseidoniales archaeon]
MRIHMAIIHCLGAGLIGSYVAKKLSDNGHEVHAHDLSPGNVFIEYPEIIIHKENVLESCKKIEKFGDFDIIVNMLPGEIGNSIMKILYPQGINIVDLSFSEITPDSLSGEKGGEDTTILWDVGIAPGLSNMLLSLAVEELGHLENGEIRVGGNPSEKTGAWNYVAPFSPKDVIAEYTRPARVLRKKEIVTLEALTERHIITVPGRGKMEAFLTDGLRSVLHSIPATNLSEYTVRWPGHIKKFIDERDAKNLNYEKLVKEWEYIPGISEFTWLEVVAYGKNEQGIRWTVSDSGSSDGHSMARCTGLVTVFCIEEWLANPNMLKTGINAPEVLENNVIKSIISKLKEEDIEIIEEKINYSA